MVCHIFRNHISNDLEAGNGFHSALSFINPGSVGVNCANDDLIEIQVDLAGQFLTGQRDQVFRSSNQIAGADDHMIVAALHCKSSYGNGAFYLIGNSLKELTVQPDLCALFGSNADFGPAKFHFRHNISLPFPIMFF
jgi:hypothetical protein